MDRKATSVFWLSHGRRLTFPVFGGKKRYAFMKAHDESDHVVLQVRRSKPRWRTYEVVVSPDQRITDELICVIAFCSELLVVYFQKPASGGGG
jgi:hypothetical protein